MESATSEPQFYLRVARDFLNQAERALTSEIFSLAALGLVLAVENSILSVISCFKSPSTIGDPVLELKFVVGERSEVFEDAISSLDKLIEVSQYVTYTYRDMLMRGNYADGKTPSEILSLEELRELRASVEKAIDIASSLVEKCQVPTL
ncbi:MAG: hypothetical protein RMH84_02980 [Sulfolobales archaeon]|nr:hypothetical protein [Sulfolobales archaeon]MCX8208129.1 hypothetical protein [Sulfolobales archaeon]MDW8010540.1 hypothetical protein [Sulfolobales archaeon]